MALEEPGNKKLNEREKGIIRMRSMMDVGMGILWLAMGIFMIFIRYFNTGLEARYDDVTMKIFGGICILYGSFRIYRGFRKNYLRER